MVGRSARWVAVCALAVLVLSGCGGGNAGSGEQPSLSPTQSVELPSPTRTVERPTPTRTPEKPTPTRTPEKPTPTRTPEKPSPTRAPASTPGAEPSSSSQTQETGSAQPPAATATASPQPAGESGQGDQVPTWVWWLLAALLVGALVAVIAAVARARRRRRWLAELAPAEDELRWFARVLLPELRRSTSLEQVVGGWNIGAPRVAAAEDRLTVLEASAPGDTERERARTLRDASRLAGHRLDALATDSPHESWALDLDEVTADLEVALGPPASGAPGADARQQPPPG